MEHEYSMEDVRQHTSKSDQWIVVQGQVCDVSQWSRKHPGGDRLLANYAGQDATDAWVAFHNDKTKVQKYLKPLVIGRLKKEDTNEKDPQKLKSEALMSDFHALRRQVEENGLLESRLSFYIFIITHVVALDILGCLVMWYWGTGWATYIFSAVLLTTAQAQAGWSQHDFGHLSVFKNNRLNHWTHIFLLNFMKGASSDWWNFRHFNHHAKPNIIRKDPDIRLDYVFLIGNVIPREWGKKRKGIMPYNKQHQYFYLILPPLLLPLYFNFEIPYFLIKRKKWLELFWTCSFFLRWQLMFGPLLGFWGVFRLFLFVRFLESHWFVWTTQMNHIPMNVDYDSQDDWVTMQLKATCNVEQSAFNDWFSGHLNFQIEHHLFPTMPRHNFHKIAPAVKALCTKHGLDYQCKTLLGAFRDIVGSLKSSGELWQEAYDM